MSDGDRLSSACGSLYRENGLFRYFAHFSGGLLVLLGCWVVSVVKLLILEAKADLGFGIWKVPAGCSWEVVNSRSLKNGCANHWAFSPTCYHETPSFLSM